MIYYAIPAYNEEKSLSPLIEGIASVMERSGLDYQIVVVDDGSTDATGAEIERLSKTFPLVSLKNERNLGLGRTLSRALKKATELAAPGDVIVTLDGDATHDPSYVPALANRIAAGADVAIASRFAAGGEARGVAAYRRFLSSGAGMLLKIFFPINGVRDYTSGFRAYRAETLKKAFDELGDGFITETGFSASPEIILKLHGRGATIQEEPFVLRYDLKGGESKIRITKTISQYLKMIARLKLKSFRRSDG
ncbi:MAG: glycosyltransferase [Actinobacteria bacterium]|nr:glycosyltransferase [Actinomycetota bacterium]